MDPGIPQAEARGEDECARVSDQDRGYSSKIGRFDRQPGECQLEPHSKRHRWGKTRYDHH